jgi:hypothetical protein
MYAQMNPHLGCESARITVDRDSPFQVILAGAGRGGVGGARSDSDSSDSDDAGGADADQFAVDADGNGVPKHAAKPVRMALINRVGAGRTDEGTDLSSAPGIGWSLYGCDHIPEVVADPDRFKLFVRNLSYDTTQSELTRLFSRFGTVVALHLFTDRESGRPKGFGTVSMADASGQLAAISSSGDYALHGRDVEIALSENKIAQGKPKARRPARPELVFVQRNQKARFEATLKLQNGKQSLRAGWGLKWAKDSTGKDAVLWDSTGKILVCGKEILCGEVMLPGETLTTAVDMTRGVVYFTKDMQTVWKQNLPASMKNKELRPLVAIDGANVGVELQVVRSGYHSLIDESFLSVHACANEQSPLAEYHLILTGLAANIDELALRQWLRQFGTPVRAVVFRARADETGRHLFPVPRIFQLIPVPCFQVPRQKASWKTSGKSPH